MKNILTRQEAMDMLKMFKSPHFSNLVNYITVIETDPEWVKKILPPPLKPDAPIVTIAMNTGDQFSGLVCGVQCRFGDIVGSYGLGYVMDTDLAVIFGREGLGEPKKLGIITTEVKDGKFTGTVSRYGQELIRVEATVLQPGDASTIGDMDNFHYKYCIKADGSGIEGVDLICSHFKNKVSDMVIMKPDLVQLNESVHDIYGSIPVKDVKACFYATFDMVGSAKYLAKVDSDEFLPYAFLKHDDYRLTMEVE